MSSTTSAPAYKAACLCDAEAEDVGLRVSLPQACSRSELTNKMTAEIWPIYNRQLWAEEAGEAETRFNLELSDWLEKITKNLRI